MKHLLGEKGNAPRKTVLMMHCEPFLARTLIYG